MDFAEIFAKLGFNWQLAVINAVNFLVFYGILHKFVITKIAKAVEVRKKTLEKSLEDAKQLEIELSQAQEKSDEIIKEANLKANEILKSHQEDAHTKAIEIKAEAQSQADLIIKKAKQEIDVQRESMKASLLDETADLSVKAAQKVIEHEVDEKKDKQIVAEYLKQLESQISA